jgi:hypothetical protein
MADDNAFDTAIPEHSGQFWRRSARRWQLTGSPNDQTLRAASTSFRIGVIDEHLGGLGAQR